MATKIDQKIVGYKVVNEEEKAQQAEQAAAAAEEQKQNNIIQMHESVERRCGGQDIGFLVAFKLRSNMAECSRQHPTLSRTPGHCGASGELGCLRRTIAVEC